MTCRNAFKTAALGIAVMLFALSTMFTSAYASQSPYILDDYDLLDSSTQSQMEEQAQSMADEYGVGTYLLVVDDIGSKSAREFAKARWNKDDLGVGEEKSGILFMIAVDSRDYVTITHGDGIYNFTDYRISQMEDYIVNYLKDDLWEPACQEYLDLCSTTLEYTVTNGEPMDIDNSYGSNSSSSGDDLGEKLLVALGIALVVAIVVVVIVRRTLKGQLKSVAPGGNASAYLQGRVELTHATERYLGTTVSKTPIPKDDHIGSGGGGSSIDSSGFGGSSGGKF